MVIFFDRCKDFFFWPAHFLKTCLKSVFPYLVTVLQINHYNHGRILINHNILLYFVH